jgi:hypothetical protein
MAFRDESGRGRALFVESAPVNFEKPFTGSAMEMMVMLLAGPFVERTPLRRVDLLQPPLFDQDFQIAVDSCLVQGSDRSAPDLQNFMDTQGPVNLPEDFLDCVSLTCLSLHSGILITVPDCTPRRNSRESPDRSSILTSRGNYCKSVRIKH